MLCATGGDFRQVARGTDCSGGGGVVVILIFALVISLMDRPGVWQNVVVPEAAFKARDWAQGHNWSPIPGQRGNKKYENSTGLLLQGGDYVEYDIDGNKPRGSERVVVDKKTGKSWYTNDHYNSFVPMPDMSREEFDALRGDDGYNAPPCGAIVDQVPAC